jgi:hypothetical protein
MGIEPTREEERQKTVNALDSAATLIGKDPLLYDYEFHLQLRRNDFRNKWKL